MRIIKAVGAPMPNGHYSQAIAAGGLIFLSAQLPIIPGTNATVPDGIQAQARQTIYNSRAILEAAGAGLAQVVSASIYVTDIELWPRVDTVWAEVFGDCRPARGVFCVEALHLGASIAIQMIAAAPDDRPQRLQRR
jgi:2-iminobutanoate/2-iminopropanoate deaminase